MEQSQIEIVKYPKVKHIKMFVNKIKFVGNHMHNDFELFLTLSGHGVMKLNATNYEFGPGDIFFINTEDVHSITSSLDNRPASDERNNEPTSLFIQISNNFLRDYFSQLRSSVFKSGNLREVLSPSDYR